MRRSANVQQPEDLGCKLSDEIDADTHRNLSDDCLIPFHSPIGVPGLPCCGSDTASESAEIGEKLGAQGSFRPVVGNEVSNGGVTKSGYESGAPATVITWFPSEQPVGERGNEFCRTNCACRVPNRFAKPLAPSPHSGKVLWA